LITILTTGSRGDTQPYLALGMALENAGASVRIAAFENYADFVKGYGLEFHPIRGDVSRVAAGEGAAHARQADNPLKLMLSFNKLKKLVGDLQQDYFSACIGSDAIVYHPGAPIGYYAGLHFDIPSILATPFPMAPTRTYPALIFYNGFRLGRSYNLATHKIFEQIMWSASSSAVKQFWLRQFRHAPQNFGCPFSRQTTQRLPTIISCSDHVFPTPGDWSEHIHNTGFGS
jgi:sterol 3beta-glucosyltransferase